jgi:heat shock protein HslJ
MMKTMLLLPLALALAACAQTPPGQPAAPTATTPAGTTPATAGDEALLTGYAWTLDSANDAQGKRIDALFPAAGKGLVLGFADGNASVSGGCNRMGGSYAVDAGKLSIGQMRSTMMACAPAAMQADEAIGKLLAQPQQWRIEEGGSPRLQLVAADGSSSAWVGNATAQTRFGGPGETVFLEVAPQRIACNHPLIPDYECLRVREIRYDANGLRQSPPGEWEAFYGDIEGFEFREGERKVLRLKKFKRDPAPADASSIAYVLDMVVESELVPADGGQ